MQTRVLTALIAASLGWGMAGVGTRYLFGEGVTTFTVVVVRTLTATVAVLVVGLTSGTRVDRAAWRDGSIIGVLRIGIAPILFISSLQHVSAGVEGIFITLIPATTAALAAVFLGERLDRHQIAGLFIGLLGTLLIVASGESGIGGDGGDVRLGAMFALWRRGCRGVEWGAEPPVCAPTPHDRSCGPDVCERFGRRRERWSVDE